ncbi:MAG: hypothetical protein PVH42_07905 [Desulfobacterales bacterium]
MSKDMPYFTFEENYQSNSSSAADVRLTDGTQILLSRTGYTGEFGYEILVDPRHLVKVWQTLFLQDNRRTIRVRVIKDIRPHRTVRHSINKII